MSKYFQVGDNFFEVKLDEKKGILIEPVKPDAALAEQMENFVLADSKEISVSLFQDVVNNARCDLQRALEKNIKGTVLNIMGFSKDSWGSGGYSVDHCNGRMSAVTGLIAEEVKQKLLKIELGQDFSLTDKEKEEMKRAMRKDFMEAYRRKAQELVYGQGQELARTHFNSLVEEAVKSRYSEMSKLVLQKIMEKAK